MKRGNVTLSAVGLVLALSVPGWAQLPPICIPRLSNINDMGNTISLRWGIPSKEEYDAMRMRPTIGISFPCLVTSAGATSNGRPATDAFMQGPPL